MADIVRVTDHLVAGQPAEQLVNWHIKCLAFNIPQGNIYRRDGCRLNSLRREKPTPKQHLPQIFGSERILADQQWLKMLNRAYDCQFAPGNSTFPYPVNALIGVHDDKRVIPRTMPDRICFDIG